METCPLDELFKVAPLSLKKHYPDELALLNQRLTDYLIEGVVLNFHDGDGIKISEMLESGHTYDEVKEKIDTWYTGYHTWENTLYSMKNEKNRDAIDAIYNNTMNETALHRLLENEIISLDNYMLIRNYKKFGEYTPPHTIYKPVQHDLATALLEKNLETAL